MLIMVIDDPLYLFLTIVVTIVGTAIVLVYTG